MPVHGTGVILFFSFLAAIDTRKGSYVNVADMMFDVGFLTRISTFGTKKIDNHVEGIMGSISLGNPFQQH